MSSLFERMETNMQTGRVFLVFVAIVLFAWGLASISLKILGVAVATLGFAFLIWFPGRIEHQRKLYTNAIIKLGVLLVAAGLLMLIFG
ncbi:MAG: hypothetical protein V1887_02000 [Candidatus Aenigmatarchaeota archaeon]